MCKCITLCPHLNIKSKRRYSYIVVGISVKLFIEIQWLHIDRPNRIQNTNKFYMSNYILFKDRKTDKVIPVDEIAIDDNFSNIRTDRSMNSNASDCQRHRVDDNISKQTRCAFINIKYLSAIHTVPAAIKHKTFRRKI